MAVPKRGAEGSALKILLFCSSFDPNVGGREIMARMLAEGFVEGGHRVTLVTRTLAPPSYKSSFPFQVVRQPSRFEFLKLVRECDVYFQAQVSLKAAWPLLMIRRPWVITYQNWLPESRMRQTLQQFLVRHAHNVCCSNAVAATIHAPSVVVPNCYDESTFRERGRGPRDRQLIFVGRLIRDKGAHVLIEALRLLRSEGLCPGLTVAGIGPQEEALRQQADGAGLSAQVEFVGKKTAPELANLLNLHQILVVPSLWQEPFGIVALEGIACGCVVVGSEGGGLKDAIGGCGVTFPNGNADALADALAGILSAPWKFTAYRRGANEHLSRHTKTAVVRSYLNVIQAIA
jgi:glycogen(starch) synthase